MSHLFKDNKKIFVIIKTIIISFIFVIFYFGYQNYIGSKYYYVLFSLLSNFLIYFAFRKNAFFFETFFSLFLWLGFWFKFTITIGLIDGIFREGVGLFSYQPDDFDYVLLISSVGIFAFLFSGYIRENFLFNYDKHLTKKVFTSKKYVENRKVILSLFLILILTVGFFNFYFKIYQKGMVPNNNIFFLISGSFKWLLLFGLASFSSVIIYLELNILKKIRSTTIIIVFFENFLSSLTMISRGMIFNSISILFGIYKYSKKITLKLSIIKFLKYLSIIIIFFYISVISVNYLRINYFFQSEPLTKSKIQKKESDQDWEKKIIIKQPDISWLHYEIISLSVNRWVGIDPLMSMSAKKELLSFDLLKESLSERFNKDEPTFYEKTFELKRGGVVNNTNVKGNTLLGIIPYLFYSGSLTFLIASMIVITIFSSFLEFISYKVSCNNLIFSSLIGQIVAFRLIHFGFLPHQTYLYFGSILLNIVIVYLIYKFLK